MEKESFLKYIITPVGCLEIVGNTTSLLQISFKEESKSNSIVQPDILYETATQLNEYFQGKRQTFSLNISPAGTPFQKTVWEYVSTVKFGETASYLEIAKQTGSVNNSRAVGMANGKNPIPIIIPCHRIIGNNGKLTGYAGGIERKRWLLQHELQFSNNAGLLF